MAVKSATEVGIAYNDYQDQIIAAKQTVDRVAARASSGKGRLFWLLVQKALLTYISCRNVWGVKFTEDWGGHFPETIDIASEFAAMLLSNHPQLSQVVQKGLLFGGSLPIDDVLQVLWAEASETIEECQSNIER